MISPDFRFGSGGSASRRLPRQREPPSASPASQEVTALHAMAPLVVAQPVGMLRQSPILARSTRGVNDERRPNRPCRGEPRYPSHAGGREDASSAVRQPVVADAPGVRVGRPPEASDHTGEARRSPQAGGEPLLERHPEVVPTQVGAPRRPGEPDAHRSPCPGWSFTCTPSPTPGTCVSRTWSPCLTGFATKCRSSCASSDAKAGAGWLLPIDSRNAFAIVAPSTSRSKIRCSCLGTSSAASASGSGTATPSWT